ncbi:MAG: hypothetical protein NVSMB9_18540 [Isosphaeraceae bacterium]
MIQLNKPFERAMTLAALSGLKIALGPAFLTTARQSPNSQGWAMAAAGEMLLDKVGIFPARFRPSLLIPHTLAGAWVARESLREDGVEEPWGAVMGAVVAAGVARVAPMIRISGHKVLGVPDLLLGLAEDYLALRLGSEAMGMSMKQVAQVGRGMVDDIGEQVMPALESIRGSTAG